ncbi:hypothetical protein PHLGIDRAFT_123424 [Phlebiopsis gigantea 11061_1 CR5-6]|uniref:Ribonuclease H1 N-terminal domain-containing protein n=1 Tax=Phlebiopsis gigantea (strain 11061_1 CR5-6) TaxID=745531 RepID=A0A0C3RYN6_PHLG1|nr:hypothetical protein PHLGIDRAFT_123424 [Phlebiopsis gigantea 11061_1 CR5-6]
MSRAMPSRGHVHGLTAADVPPECDMTILPHGDISRWDGKKVYVVWNGFKRGLFWCWDDAGKSVNFFKGARHKWYHGLNAARIAYFMGDDEDRGDPTLNTSAPEDTLADSSVRPAEQYDRCSTPKPREPAPHAAPHGVPSPPDSRADDSEYFSFKSRTAASTVSSSRESRTSSTSRTMSGYDDVEVVSISSSDEDDTWAYIVVRGRRPGVYSDRRTALSNLGKSSKRSLRTAPTVEGANAAFVRYYMADQVVQLSK